MGGGKGRLTDAVIESLPVYFGRAIRYFSGDVDGMFRAIWVVFHHSISDDDQHDHQFFPSGLDSWCKFNCALTENEETPKHTPKLPKDLGPFIKPVFTELSKRELLERCVLGAIQNQNESFNNIVWSRCPKTESCSLVSVDIAVNLAAITFNHGLEGLEPLFVQLIGSSPSAFTAHCITSSDDKQLKKAGQKAECTSQRRRKSLRSMDWRRRKDTSLRKAPLMSLVHFNVPPLFFFSFFFFFF